MSARPIPSRVPCLNSRLRQFTDAAGRQWLVSESARSHGRSWARGHLDFVTFGHARRLWSYPREWRSLSDAELEALNGRA